MWRNHFLSGRYRELNIFQMTWRGKESCLVMSKCPSFVAQVGETGCFVSFLHVGSYFLPCPILTTLGERVGFQFIAIFVSGFLLLLIPMPGALVTRAGWKCISKTVWNALIGPCNPQRVYPPLHSGINSTLLQVEEISLDDQHDVVEARNC